MKYFIQLISLIALAFTLNTAIAKGGKPPPAPEPGLLNVVTVSPQYGDYDSLIDALDSIGDAAEDNQYVIQIGPGVYDIGNAQIIMKPWVLIQGAGRSFTVIRGSRASSLDPPGNEAAMVIGTDKAAMIRMGIKNTGSGLLYSIGIRNDNASPAIKHVKVEVAGSVNNEGISNHNNSKPTIQNVVTLSGTGVVADNSSPFILDSYLAGTPGLKLIDSPGSRAVHNTIIGGVEVIGILLSVTPTSSSICRGNYDQNLQDVYCPSTP